MVRHVQAVVGKMNFVFKFEYGYQRDKSASSLSYICEKEEFGKESDNIISDLPKIGQGELLTIYEDTIFEGDRKFGKGMYL